MTMLASGFSQTLALLLQSPGPDLVKLGPLTLRWYGVLIALAVVLGTVLAQATARRRGLDPTHISNLLGWLVLGAIPGARLYYVAFEWQRYSQLPWTELFAIWHGGIAIHGALLGGGIALYFFVRFNKLNFWQLSDTIMPSVILGQAIGRWGNFFNNEAHGRVLEPGSQLLVQLRLPDGSLVHPTFLYESIWNLGLFALLLPLAWRKPQLRPGTVFALYLIGYSLGRFWIEGLRTDSLMVGPLRMAQVVSLIFIGVGSLLLWWLYKVAKPPVSDEPSDPAKVSSDSL